MTGRENDGTTGRGGASPAVRFSAPPFVRSSSHSRAAWLFLTPNLLGFLAFSLIPVTAALVLSLTDWDLFTPPRWAGLRNFHDLLGFQRRAEGWVPNDPRFWKYLANTLFLMLGVPVNVAASLGIALLLHRQARGRVFFRTLFYLPTICMGVGVYILWKWLLGAEPGLLNWLLAKLGVAGPDWLKSYAWAKPGLMLMGLWAAAGGPNMLLYLASLQSVPAELLEAASLDGAGTVGRFRHVTWPHLGPTTFFIVVMALIHGFQGGFEPAYIMTRGGPDGATTTVSFYLFTQAFRWFHMGYAAAIAVILFVLVVSATGLVWRFGKRGAVV